MPSVGQPERATQNRVVALFRDELGYRTLGDWTDRAGNSNIEESLLTAYLSKVGYAPQQISRAIYLLRTEADNPNRRLYDNNRAVYSLLRYGVPVKIEAGRVHVTVNGFHVQQMKTKWGGCNPAARTLRLNTELARKPKACLEYILVHEMSHLLEPTHGPGFVALMDRFMPAWRETQTLLNRLPARFEDFNHPAHCVDPDPGKTHPEACVATPAWKLPTC